MLFLRLRLRLSLGEIVGVDAVAHAEHTLASAGTRCDAALDRSRVERREQRLFRCERIVVAEPATLEQAPEAPRDLPCHALHLGVVGWREWVETQRSALRPRIDAVEDERVEVEVQVERVWNQALDAVELPHVTLYEGTKHTMATDAPRPNPNEIEHPKVGPPGFEPGTVRL